MPPFKTSLCRIPGGFLSLPDLSAAHAQAASLVQFSLMALLFAVLPAMLYWQHRRRRWWTMGAGLTVFILALDHLMLKDRGSMWQTLAATGILWGPSYLALTVLWASLRGMGRAVSGDGRAAALSWSDCVVIALLAIMAHLLFFIAATIADVAGAALLGVVGDFVNCLYQLARPVDFRTHGDQLNMLLAALPTLVLATLLQAWLRRRRAVIQGTRPR